MQPILIVSSSPRPRRLGPVRTVSGHCYSSNNSFNINDLHVIKDWAVNFGAGNNRHLYEFLMECNVFIKAENSIERLGKTDRYEWWKVRPCLKLCLDSSLAPDSALFFKIEARAFCSQKHKEKSPGALAMSQRFPV
jgi:hypothetical protein